MTDTSLSIFTIAVPAYHYYGCLSQSRLPILLAYPLQARVILASAGKYWPTATFVASNDRKVRDRETDEPETDVSGGHRPD